MRDVRTIAPGGQRARIATGLWLLLATAASVVMRLNSPAWLIADSPHDDGLAARLAGSLVTGHWLGAYDQLTLAKVPGYPLFVAWTYDLHVPLKLAEHGVHLAAGAVTAVAVWRLCRSRLLGVVAYTLVALDPAYLGATSSRMYRDTLYGSLSLLLLGGSLLLLTLVPALVARGPRWAVPAVVVAGPVLGLVAAGYYLCREERSWLGPALLVAGLAGVAHWRREGGIGWRHLLVVAGTAALAAFTLLQSLQWVAGNNDHLYGTAVVSDLADGEIARAYAEWQRVEAGPETRYVPVNERQRAAVYAVSPAAAELEPALEEATIGWWRLGCGVGVCDDYIGAFFVWALRDAARLTGHEDTGAEAQRFFGRIADDIARACGHELTCTDRGIGPMPPRSRLDTGELATSYREVAASLLSYDVGEPERSMPSGGDPRYWELMTRPLHGVGSQAEYAADEARAMRDQEAVAALTDLYRWAVRIGAVLALAGVVLGVATRAGRRHPVTVLVCATMLTGALTRVAVVALIDATSWPAVDNQSYLLPGVEFLVLFVALGCSLLVTALRGDRAGHEPAGPPTQAWPDPVGEPQTLPGPAPRRAAVRPAAPPPPTPSLPSR
ncbi:MAG TPA: hypothetical protein VFI47_02740 [Acidimicrobiales bacterium]|nr:hypothetical protein [Acidimicrobiales bacterium]